MNDTVVTFQGWVGSELDERLAGTTPVVTFRVASTPRRYKRENNGWTDMETNWYTVNAWRMLGINAVKSLQKGDAVVVHGKQTTQVYTDNGGRTVQSIVIDATSIGHDLTRGTSTWSKSIALGGDQDDEGLKERNAELGAGGPQMSSDGELIEDLVDTSTGEILDQSVA